MKSLCLELDNGYRTTMRRGDSLEFMNKSTILCSQIAYYAMKRILVPKGKMQKTNTTFYIFMSEVKKNFKD